MKYVPHPVFFQTRAQRSVCRARGRRTGGRQPSLRRATAVSPGTHPSSPTSSTTHGVRRPESWGWEVTTSAGRIINTQRNSLSHTCMLDTYTRTHTQPHTYTFSLSFRNPDGDLGPWCHVYRNMKLTWELCNITKCSEYLCYPVTMTTVQ